MNLLVSVNEVIKEFGTKSVPSTLNVDGETVPDIEVIETALKEAQLEVFSYLRNVGVDITNITNDTIFELRRHILFITRYKYQSKTAGSLKPENDIMITYEKSIEYLDKISKGDLVLSTTKSKKSGFRSVRVETY